MTEQNEHEEECSRCCKLLHIFKQERVKCEHDPCPDSSDAHYFCYDCNLYLCHGCKVNQIGTHRVFKIPYADVLNDKPYKIIDCNQSIGEPWGIAFSTNGMWALADCSNHCVYLFDAQDNLFNKFGKKGEGHGEFQHPEGLAFDKYNYLYVVDNCNSRVQKFAGDGTYILCFGDKVLDHPNGIMIFDELVYVADTGNSRIAVFNIGGQNCTTFGTEHLCKPFDVAVNTTKRELLVPDYEQRCIYRFTIDGHYVGLLDLNLEGTRTIQLSFPYSVTTYSNAITSYIILADTWNHRILILDDKGKCVDSFGSNGADQGQFNCPCWVAISPSSKLYVSDRYNKRIQIFNKLDV
ncbi:RING finger protein nhl-1-like [Dysidea avara]|uniref:RING finger protein nhl-1-like n=1 Tax=Dysidea avara TaxID=196820 RepID=UPI0033286D42